MRLISRGEILSNISEGTGQLNSFPAQKVQLEEGDCAPDLCDISRDNLIYIELVWLINFLPYNLSEDFLYVPIVWHYRNFAITSF